jgi:inner membrane transporter RhtA
VKTHSIGSNPRLAAAMAFGSTVSVQSGAAAATTLFDSVGALGAVFLRAVFGALLLLALAGGSFAPISGRFPRDVVLFGIAVAGATLFFYAAISRLPLGIAVTLQFVGPLGVAVAGSRRRLDLLWVGLAAAGIVLLSGLGGDGIDALGTVFALLAGGFWAAYIVLSARVGANYRGFGAAAAAAVVSALVLTPTGLAVGGAELLVPAHLAVGLAVGLFSSAVPYALEMEALRRLPKATFGVLMSLEPAVAAAVGFVALSQGLSATEAVGIALVVVASAGALREAGALPAPAID